jgi:hypothetical protein
MGEAQKAQLYRTGLTVAHPSEFDSTHSQRAERRIFARNLDMQQIIDAREWASLTDAWLFLQGWNRGAEWGLSEMDISCRGSEQELSKQVP